MGSRDGLARHGYRVQRSIAGATAGIKAKGRRGVAILRELDSIMAVTLRNDPVLLGAWKTARRIVRPLPEETPAGTGTGSTPPPTGS